MFFLLRLGFCLAVVLAMLPSDDAKPSATLAGVTAACGQAGVKPRDVSRAAPHETRPTASTVTLRRSAANASQGTLTATDIAPRWRGPRADPHRKHGA